MSLTRLKNIITSRTGRIIYVNPDDFDASDAIDNRGNSALRPFKSLQRAFLEVARFSYRVGLSNDEFDAFSIMQHPAEYIVDNRPGDVLYTNVAPLDANSNLDLTSPNNVLYKYNSIEGEESLFPEVVRWLAPIFVVPRLFLSTFLILRHMLLRESIQRIKYLPAPQSSRSQVVHTSGSSPSSMVLRKAYITNLTAQKH